MIHLTRERTRDGKGVVSFTSSCVSMSDGSGTQSMIVGSLYMAVSENSGTPKSSILIGFSIINHPFWGTPIFGNTHIGD